MTRRGNPYHDGHGRFTTGGGATVVSELASEQRHAIAEQAGTPAAGAPGSAPRPQPPTVPPVHTSGDGTTSIYVRDGKEPMFEVWRNGELVEAIRATRAWRQEKHDLIAKHGGQVPTSGASTINSAIRATTGRGSPPPAEGEKEELHRLLSEELLFQEPTADAATLSRRAALQAETWAEYGTQYGHDILDRELARARRASAGRARAMAVKPSIRQELDLTNLLVENRIAENHAANRDRLYREAREEVQRVSQMGLGKYNEWLTRETSVWYQREQAEYGDDLERETLYFPFDDE
ncbi:MAG: hypothetical protein EI684_06385 [Candidatus Viridilinea halotolerans]|uniref:Uncharacterized protein n=1 Tax=Candidatus Viridilinea halotolerans TaxID=2491704 RepID=A0A426U4B4_9CHLR|nr:MAG: hypothetical protein EI684_06385 [Candidatus Viridilinea halotolerans]